MRIETWDLFLDESGEFRDDPRQTNMNPSLVGGVLMPAGTVDLEKAKELFEGRKSHANEDHSPEEKARLFKVLRALRQLPGHFVFFQNTERLMIVDPDVTYLNILAEGIARLLRDRARWTTADSVKLRVKIALRNDTLRKADGNASVDIPVEMYRQRLRERIILAMGAERLPNAEYEILPLASAKQDFQLMLADVTCNYFLTRKSRGKFTEEERSELKDSLFDEYISYSVFEEATARYLGRLMAENSYGDVMTGIASTESLSNETKKTRSTLFERLKQLSAKERDLYFRQVSLKIGVYEGNGDFDEGRRFAENYRARVLEPLAKEPRLGDAARRWMFDTDFYLLTMADHQGDAKGCEAYDRRCHENLGIVLQGWEQMDYYHLFCVREINVRMGQFDFEGVLASAKGLEEFLAEARTLSELVRDAANLQAPQRSATLGKVKGQCVQAYANLLGRRPELLDAALAASDQALKEFGETEDRLRQYQYRAQLFVRVHQPEGALAALIQNGAIGDDVSELCRSYLAQAAARTKGLPVYEWMHYTCVMRAFLALDDPRGEQMGTAMLEDAHFAGAIAVAQSEHPWQIILWNIAALYLHGGSVNNWLNTSKRALKISRDKPDRMTMYSFAVCIAADRLLAARQKAPKQTGKMERELESIVKRFEQNEIEKMGEWFGLPWPTKAADLSDERLKWIADSWLR